ncbi:MAG: class I SAM-dependent methyltransferase [Deltaproteobacteria bacterium]|nr:class I SAM-dependent methyltransferase [Deltaproteobacteria bacterium]
MGTEQDLKRTSWLIKQLYAPDAFARRDETDDKIFYSVDRFVEHLDSVALATVERVVGSLVVEKEPVILDLMASWDSHIPPNTKPSSVTGIGLNKNELAGNPALTQYLVHDLNDNPFLPLPDDTFDAVLNTVSIDYMTQPVEIFREVGRVLKPNGVFLVIFSNRMFPQKVVKAWWRMNEEERVTFVEELFKYVDMFDPPKTFVSRNKARPPDDKHAHLGIPSDPVYVVYADKKGPYPLPRPELLDD